MHSKLPASLRRLLPIFVLILLLAAVYLVISRVQESQDVRQRAAGSTTVSITPATASKVPGEQFTLNISIDAGSDALIVARPYVKFDQTKLRIDNYALAATNPFLPQTQSGTKILNNEQGFAELEMFDFVGKTGSGTLAVLTFTALAEGTSQVEVIPQLSEFNALAEDNVLMGATPAQVTVSSISGPLPSPSSGACTDQSPPAPTGLGASTDDTKGTAVLYWSTVSGATHYSIRYGTVYGQLSESISNVGNTDRFPITLLQEDQTYYFEVYAWKNCAMSVASSAYSLKVLGNLQKFYAILDGQNEVPANNSSGKGLALLNYDANNKKFSLKVHADGISIDNFINAHIHVGNVGVSGDPIVDLGGPQPDPGSPGWGGYLDEFVSRTFYDQSFPAANESDLLNSRTYINLHTDQYPNGEIRGQLLPGYPPRIEAEPSPNPITWQNQYVSLQADDFYILVDGQKYFGDVNDITIHSDPGGNTYQTLEVSWLEKNGVGMGMNFYFHSDGQKWWSSEFRTSAVDARHSWITYPDEIYPTNARYFESNLGTSFVGNLNVTAGAANGQPGSVHFTNLRLQAFKNVTAGPSPSPSFDPTMATMRFKTKFMGVSTQRPSQPITYGLTIGGSAVGTGNTITATSDANGIFTSPYVAPVTPGSYDLYITGPAHLKKRFPVTLVAGENTIDLTGTSLIAGDIVKNNIINIVDVTALVFGFGLPVPSGGSSADLNFDGVVNIVDFTILAVNWLKTGD